MRKTETQTGEPEIWGIFLELGAMIIQEVKESPGNLKKFEAQKVESRVFPGRLEANKPSRPNGHLKGCTPGASVT